MPFTRISLLKGKPPLYLGARSDGLRQALVESFEVPPDDRFQVIDQREPDELIFDRNYLGGPRSDDFVLFEIAAGRPRSVETKKAFHRRLVALLAERPGARPQDVMTIIATTGRDEWSFGGGEAQLIDAA